METYLDFQKSNQASHEKHEAWKRDLFESANSLYIKLVEKLDPPKEQLIMKTSNDTLVWDRIMLEKPIDRTIPEGKINQKLLNIYNSKNFIFDGKLFFSISFNFPISKESITKSVSNVSSITVSLNICFINSIAIYKIYNFNDPEISTNGMNIEEVCSELIKNLSESTNSDPYIGYEKPPIGFSY